MRAIVSGGGRYVSSSASATRFILFEELISRSNRFCSTFCSRSVFYILDRELRCILDNGGAKTISCSLGSFNVQHLMIMFVSKECILSFAALNDCQSRTFPCRTLLIALTQKPRGR